MIRKISIGCVFRGSVPHIQIIINLRLILIIICLCVSVPISIENLMASIIKVRVPNILFIVPFFRYVLSSFSFSLYRDNFNFVFSYLPNLRDHLNPLIFLILDNFSLIRLMPSLVS